MSNTSRTGGYLVPTSTTNLDDILFSEFLQPMIAGITGIAGQFVRPRWQAEPPNLPAFGTNWAAVGSVSRESDTHAYVAHSSASGTGSDTVVRNQVMDFIVSFYGPNAESLADQLIMGFSVTQNLEQLIRAGYGFIGCGSPTMLGALLQEKWTRQVDVTFQLRRVQVYVYPVLDVESAQVALDNDQGVKQITVNVQ